MSDNRDLDTDPSKRQLLFAVSMVILVAGLAGSVADTAVAATAIEYSPAPPPKMPPTSPPPPPPSATVHRLTVKTPRAHKSRHIAAPPMPPVSPKT